MACLDNNNIIIMYNNNNSSSSSSSDHHHKGSAPPMSPRISFSNDFAESHHFQHMRNPRDQSSSQTSAPSDFEFSVSNSYSTPPPAMTTADELFFKGQLLPFKATHGHKTTTLREELLVDDDQQVSLRPPKTSAKWKGLLGLKKSQITASKRSTDTTNIHTTTTGSAE